jgi:hypothetical protein
VPKELHILNSNPRPTIISCFRYHSYWLQQLLLRVSFEESTTWPSIALVTGLGAGSVFTFILPGDQIRVFYLQKHEMCSLSPNQYSSVLQILSFRQQVLTCVQYKFLVWNNNKTKTEGVSRVGLAQLVRFIVVELIHLGSNTRFDMSVAFMTNYSFSERRRPCRQWYTLGDRLHESQDQVVIVFQRC